MSVAMVSWPAQVEDAISIQLSYLLRLSLLEKWDGNPTLEKQKPNQINLELGDLQIIEMSCSEFWKVQDQRVHFSWVVTFYKFLTRQKRLKSSHGVR